MPERLLAAVNALNRSVKSLERTLINDYPKRIEIERRFATKRQSQTRVLFIMLLLILTTVSSFFITVSTISVCFLGHVTYEDRPRACSAMPGYEQTQKASERRVKLLEKHMYMMNENRQRINKLEQQVN